MLSVSINSNKEEGYANITKFKFSAILNPRNLVKRVLWYFGDGATSTEFAPEHIYTTPGKYTVSLIAYGNQIDTVSGINQNSLKVEKNLEIKLLINESVYFDFVPPPTFAGHINRYPFRINISSNSVEEHHVSLAAMFSKSDAPSDLESKWSFLKPQWKFLDLNGRPIKSVKTTDTVIYANESGGIDPSGTLVAGVTGFAEFYFTDDIYNADLAATNKPYTTIIATLQTSAVGIDFYKNRDNKSLPSYANSTAQATCPYILLWRTPDTLKITENGIRPHINPRWSTSEVPVVINSTFSKKYPDELPDGNGVKLSLPQSFFIHNYPLSNSTPISLEAGLDSLSSVFSPAPSFVWTDESYHKTPGYYKGTFNVPNINALAVSITANATIPIPPLTSNYFNPLLWLSNPEAGLVAVAQYQYQQSAPLTFNQTANIAHVHSFDMPLAMSELSGSHGIYCIAALPYPTYHAWMLDSDSQYLYRVSTKGQILSAVNINEILKANRLGFLIPDVSSPANFVIDGMQNMWITLYDSNYTIKLDKSGNLASIVNPLGNIGGVQLPRPSNLPYNREVESRYDQQSFFTTSPQLTAQDDVNLLEPSYLDTDIYNNVYITYTNVFSGLLVKCDTLGNLLYTISFPSNRIPYEISCDNQNRFWLSTNERDSDDFYIEHRNYNGTYFADDNGNDYIFGPYLNASNLTIDLDQNLWFSYGYRSICKINSSNYQVETMEVVNEKSLSIDNFDDYCIEGIAAGLNGKIYVINSVENQVYVIDARTFTLENSFFVNPQGFVYYLNSSNQLQRYYGIGNKSLQAYGDWTGFQWINKYGKYYTKEFNDKNSEIFLSGVSQKLDFYIDNTYSYEAYKFNEDYNLTQQLRELAFVPSLHESESLFNDFLGPIFGDKNLKHEDLGVELYEKIANFVKNHSDIDECNLNQLYNLADLVDLHTDDFRLSYPSQIERLVNLASINQSRLWGVKDLFSQEFNKNYSDGSNNRGKNLTSLYYLVTAGVPVVLKNKSLNDYKLIYTGNIKRTPQENLKKYDLDILADFLKLPQPWRMYYEFYEYIPKAKGGQLEGVINWENTQTVAQNKKPISFVEGSTDAFSPFQISVTDQTGSYPSTTIFSLLNGELNVTTDGDPYPAFAGINFVNDGTTERLGKNNTQIVDQDYNFIFKYKAGQPELTESHNTRTLEPLGVTVNGVPIHRLTNYDFQSVLQVLSSSLTSNLVHFNEYALLKEPLNYKVTNLPYNDYYSAYFPPVSSFIEYEFYQIDPSNFWTLETWFKPVSTTQKQCLFSFFNYGEPGIFRVWLSGGLVTLNNGSETRYLSEVPVLSGQWNHLVISNLIYTTGFVNGINAGTVDITSPIINGVRLGCELDFSNQYWGYISNMRLTSNEGLYNQNSPRITIPPIPYTSDTTAALHLLQLSSPDIGYTLNNAVSAFSAPFYKQGFYPNAHYISSIVCPSPDNNPHQSQITNPIIPHFEGDILNEMHPDGYYPDARYVDGYLSPAPDWYPHQANDGKYYTYSVHTGLSYGPCTDTTPNEFVDGYFYIFNTGYAFRANGVFMSPSVMLDPFADSVFGKYINGTYQNSYTESRAEKAADSDYWYIFNNGVGELVPDGNHQTINGEFFNFVNGLKV